MINSYDDLKAQRAKAHNDLEVAKVKLIADTRSWQEEVKPLNTITSAAKYMLTNKAIADSKNSLMGHGIQFGVNTLLAKTAFRGLPGPLSVVVPHVLENVAINYTKDHGRDWLIKGLRWVKKITDEKPEPGPTEVVAVVVVEEPVVVISEEPVTPLLTEQENQLDNRFPQ